MSLGDDLKVEVKKIFRTRWESRKGQVVPQSENLQFSNKSVLIEGTILYADLDGSTNMVDRYKPEFAAEIYKSYLYSAAKIIRLQGGSIASYDGDRIMAVFIGKSKNSDAANTALKINYAVTKIINPAIEECYPKSTFTVKQVVGIDTSDLLVARTGIRGSNDLVWVGRAANYAAKLTERDSTYPSQITSDVYNLLNEGAKYSNDGQPMWKKSPILGHGRKTIYTSTWWKSC